MPYVDQASRDKLYKELTALMEKMRADTITVGELNYAVTMLCQQYVYCTAADYAHAVNDIVGVLECAKLEYYGQIAVPYEKRKRDENGDVYWIRPLFKRKK